MENINKTDVLFIVHDVYQEDNVFPLGIGYLSAILERHGYSVEIYCMDVYHYTNRDLKNKLEQNNYHIIGLGFLAARFKETILDLCETINIYKKDAWLVLGGHCPSAIPEYILEKTNCDIVVVGEGEEAIVDILISKKLGLLIEKQIIYTPIVENIDVLPYPAWHLFPMDIYTDNIKTIGMTEKDKAFPIVSTRGCINRCTFCYRQTKGIRLRKIEDVIEEMKQLFNKYGVNVFLFQDELFLVSKTRLKSFIKRLKDNNLNIKYTVNARVDVIDEEIIVLLKESGCILLNIGFESSSQKVLDHMKKNTTVEQNIFVLKLCKKHKLGYGLNFIWGYPEDNKKSLMDNVKLIKKYNTYAQLRTIRPVTPYPICELYYEAIDKGLIDGPNDFFNKFINSDLITVNLTKYPDDICYKWLLDANSELIYDYYEHMAELVIEQFHDLYNNKTISFRGVRHDTKEKNTCNSCTP